MVGTLRGAVDVCWVVFIVVWIVAAASAKRTVSRPPNQVVYRVFWAASFVLLYLGRPRRSGIGTLTASVIHVGTSIAGVGVVCAFVGLVLALWARATLGSNWSGTITLKEDHTLVQNGPYRMIRHPIYTAILLLFLGSLLVYGTVGTVLALPLSTIGFIIKARQEEALMQSTFPDAYPEYRNRTKMLVPGVF